MPTERIGDWGAALLLFSGRAEPYSLADGTKCLQDGCAYSLEAKGMEINLLEVNTTPGMTATSFIPQQVKAAGLDIKDVLSDIIDNELEMKG